MKCFSEVRVGEVVDWGEEEDGDDKCSTPRPKFPRILGIGEEDGCVVKEMNDDSAFCNSDGSSGVAEDDIVAEVDDERNCNALLYFARI